MTRIDLHIIRRLLLGFTALVAILIVFFVVLHYVEYIDDFMDRGATMRQVFLTYYPSYLPEIVKLISPLAIFLAAVYLTSRLAQSLQITALQTSGISLYRLMIPYIVVGVCVTLVMFWFNGWIVPQTNRVVLDFERQYLRDAPEELDNNNIHRQNAPGHFVTVGFYDRELGVAHRVSLQRFDDEHRLVARIDAPRMQWVDSLATWRLSDAIVRSFRGEVIEQRRYAAELDTTLNILPRDLARTVRDVESMTIPEARAYLEDLARSGAGGVGRAEVAYYVKYSYPVANLILLLIAMPLAAVRRRGGQAVQIGLGLLVAFAYLALQKLTEPFGYTGTVSPLLTAWLPHALFLGFALLTLFRARK